MPEDISMGEILSMQAELLAKHAHEWSPVTPENGRSAMLWMIEEIGEAAAIIKKKGDNAIMLEPAVRAAFVEEMSDALMYFAKVMLCYGFAAEDIALAYRKKHARNMNRDFTGEGAAFLNT